MIEIPYREIDLVAEARAAADSGQIPADACRFAFGSEAGRRWMSVYNERMRELAESRRYPSGLGEGNG